MPYRKCLLMGLNYIGTSFQLNGCINDMKNLQQYLISNQYFTLFEIVIMSDHQKGTLYPTKANIKYQLNELIKFATSISPQHKIQLFVVYSGHGSYIKDKSTDELDHKDEVWCPLDHETNGYIVDDELRLQFLNKLPKNVDLILLSDSCNSGTIVDLRYLYRLDANDTLIINNNLIETNCNVICISGCQDNQVSEDTYLIDPTTGKYEYQGAMTAAFIANYRNGNTYNRLITKMRIWLKKRGYRQLPELSSGRQINVNHKFLLYQLIPK